MNNNARTKSNPTLYNTDKNKVVQRYQNLASTYVPNYKQCFITFAIANFEGCDLSFHIIQKFTVFPKTVS